MSANKIIHRRMRLVPPSPEINADLIAFTVMEHIDTQFPAMWQAVSPTARVSVRNAIVKAVVTEGRKPAQGSSR